MLMSCFVSLQFWYFIQIEGCVIGIFYFNNVNRLLRTLSMAPKCPYKQSLAVERSKFIGVEFLRDSFFANNLMAALLMFASRYSAWRDNVRSL